MSKDNDSSDWPGQTTSQTMPMPIVSMREDSNLLINREERITSAYWELVQEGIRPTGDTLSRRARCNRAVALNWLREQKVAG
ncbi:MAG TPA: hypothetical protein VGD98_18510 [Ktedonobacteraceae bacterium]